VQVCTSLQTDNHAKTPPLSFLQAGCPFCRPTNSVKALKAIQSTEGNVLINVLINHLEIKVHQFVRECGEFVAKAELVFSFDISCPRETVVLFLRVLVERALAGSENLQVYIVVSTCDHLRHNKGKGKLCHTPG